MKNRIFALLSIALLAGCRPAITQVPPSPAPTVNLAWTAPTTCTAQSPCSYVMSRAVATGACPATTGSLYTPLNQGAPTSGTTYTDSAPPTGVSLCYTVQTLQSGLTSQPSCPSNSAAGTCTGTPTAIPTYPGTPGGLNGTQIALAPPLKQDSKPLPVDAKIVGPVTLTAMLEKQ